MMSLVYIYRLSYDTSHTSQVLTDFDENCWIIEPEVPILRIMKRRIALHDGVSINVTIDRQNPKNVYHPYLFL